MDFQTLDIIQVHVPHDDGSLSRAIAELEARLSAYSASLRTVHKRIRGTEPPARPPAGPAVSTEAVVIEPAIVFPPIQPEAKQELSPASVLPEVVPAAPVIEETPPSRVQAEPASPEFSAQSPVENDEAVLASLDTVTAERIRVLRRLCDRKKSVRELLSELEATKPLPPPAQTKKRSWFSKG